MTRHYPVAASVIAAATLLTAVGFAASGHVVHTSGAITYLGIRQIKVNHLSCAIRTAPLSLAAGRFVIGDTVTIGCRDGLLKTIKYVPPPSNPQSTAASSPNATTGPRRSIPPVCTGTSKTTTDANGLTITTCWMLIGGG